MPPPVTVDPEDISLEFRERDQWLMWDCAADTPRRPHWCGDFGVSWTDPDDWHSFEEAYERMQDKDSWGIGYVFAYGNEDYPRGLYSAIDLDGCVEERGRPKEWLPPLKPFNGETYMEYSPSGEGIHIPLIGFDIPDWWQNVHRSEDEHEGVEVYDTKFFTFTGDKIETAADDVGDIHPDDIEEWLARVYENITGDDPREVNHGEQSSSDPREPDKSREELKEIQTTDEYDDVLDAVDQLEPRDVPLSSRKVEDENSNYESWTPGYRTSKSGKSLKRWKKDGTFFDMSKSTAGGGGGYPGFGVLSLFAAEKGIIRRPWNDLSGEDFKDAVAAARDAGAPIPEYIGTDGDLPDDAKSEVADELDAEKVWNIWADARVNGELEADSVVPELALWHVAREHRSYDLDDLPADCDELPPKAHNRALYWVNNEWPERAGLTLGDDERATARPYRSRDAAVWTWEDVRYVYDGGDGKPDKQGGRFAAVRLLRSKYHFLTPRDTEELHIYEEDLGVYEPTAKLDVNRELDRNLGEFYSQHEFKEIIGRLKAGTYVDRDALDAGTEAGTYLCCQNGVVDIDSRENLAHDPSYLFVTHIPVRYDPDAECPKIQQFLDDITERPEDKQTLLEMLGNCLLPNYNYESFLVLFGEGSNGKSTWYNIVRHFLGKQDNVTSMTLQTLAENRFASSNLLGKMANIGEDLPETKIGDLGPIKDLTGGGAVSVEPKGTQRFEMENRAKLMFAANRPPVLGEHSKAVKRRLLPVRLPYEFVSDPDPDDPMEKQAVKEGFVEERTTDDELAGLLTLALDGLDRLRETSEFSLPESHDERLEYYEQYSDPIKEFAINALENVDEARIRKDVVYNAYTAFCRTNDYETSVPSVFWRELRRTMFNVSVVRPSPDEDGVRHEYVDSAAFTELATQYIPDEVDAPIIDDEGRVKRAATDHDGPETPLSALEPGDLVTVTAEVKQLYAPDVAKAWYHAEGWLADAHGHAKIIVRADENYGLSENDVYRFDRVNVTRDDGIATIEVVPNVSAVTEIDLGDGTTDPDGHDWVVAGGADGGDAGDGAVADGGADTEPPSTEDTTPPPDTVDHPDADVDAPSIAEDTGGGPDDDINDLQSDAERLTYLVATRGSIPKAKLLALAGSQHDMPPQRAQSALDRALQYGDLTEGPDGNITH